ncbi:MAG TPA: segregation/condensation protein A [Phycisphaerales bacterium]|nr:segregation/condensation protein A [Phycisphaerales bacterium]HRQ74314.1 segregation/condensation protein A [Phycisphaerales bacterium]
MLQEDYQVALENFHGPMDLLFYLIRRAEVDIEDIPIAKITDQYLSFLRQLDDVDIDLAGEFLVMAATLIEIKSRVLMPVEQRANSVDAPDMDATGGAMNAADPRYELVQQLLAYQKYRIASEELEARRQSFLNRFPVRAAKVKAANEPDDDLEQAEPVELDMDDVHVLDLSEAYERIMATIDFTRLGDHTVEIDDTPIALHQADLIDRLSRSPERAITLQQAFDGTSISDRIGMFLATLELVRLRRVTVTQDDIAGAILLTLLDDVDAAPNDIPS